MREPRDVALDPPPRSPRGDAADGEIVPVWTFRRGLDLALVVDVATEAAEDAEPPDLRVRLLAASDERITALVVEGIAPYDADVLMYVPGRGPFEVARRDVSSGSTGPRVVLTLATLRAR
jgi:hypothetical protein